MYNGSETHIKVSVGVAEREGRRDGHALAVGSKVGNVFGEAKAVREGSRALESDVGFKALVQDLADVDQGDLVHYWMPT